ncbi:MAG TPA: divalent-cation tolerance protein CutA [Bryobacteraceae bacterium]|nr:divalent-cation tolerance protein CutA [Bryobacteraceae bacterium]
MPQKLVILSNCGSQEEAETIARNVVASGFAACVNILPGVKSIYRWQGAIEEATEWLLIIKSHEELYPQLESEIRRLHSYEVPEIIALPIVNGLAAYLKWIEGE